MSTAQFFNLQNARAQAQANPMEPFAVFPHEPVTGTYEGCAGTFRTEEGDLIRWEPSGEFVLLRPAGHGGYYEIPLAEHSNTAFWWDGCWLDEAEEIISMARNPEA